MNADVKINCTVMSKVRRDDLPFRPTHTYNQDFHWQTTLDAYNDLLDDIELQVVTYCYEETQKGAEITVHIQIWIDNPTHPPTGAGVVRLPKGAHDFCWSQGDLAGNETGVISQALANVLIGMRDLARY